MTRGVLFLQDNAPAHMLQVAMAVATKCGFKVLRHPPYSPDLAPSDFCLFPKLKTYLRGTNFGSNEGVIDAVKEHFGDQDENFYFDGISKMEQRWRKCIKMKVDFIKDSGKLFIPVYSEIHETENFLIIPRISNVGLRSCMINQRSSHHFFFFLVFPFQINENTRSKSRFYKIVKNSR